MPCGTAVQRVLPPPCGEGWGGGEPRAIEGGPLMARAVSTQRKWAWTILAWVVAAVIVVLNLKLLFDTFFG